MGKKEKKTDIWVAKLLEDCSIKYDVQGSGIKGIAEALGTASKRGTGKAGYPEYTALVNGFVLVIEDKADTTSHCKVDESGCIDFETKSVTNYAVNGAIFYAKKIVQNSTFKKVIAIGVSGDEKHHYITPVYVDRNGDYQILEQVESFYSFTERNINDYYCRKVLKQETASQKTTSQILKDAADLHELLRAYGSLKDQDKPLVVAGILLALDELDIGRFKIESLRGDPSVDTDGEQIYNAIRNRLKRSKVGPEAKCERMMNEFAIILNSKKLNTIEHALGMTPLRYYTEFIKKNIFDIIKANSTHEDFIGRFYGEFMRYSGGDGQTLGIVLTPPHICSLFCDLLEVDSRDVILDPCCGTAGFLVASMHHMVKIAKTDNEKKRIKRQQLYGYEIQSNMFVMACANMILRGDGNSHIICEDFLKQEPSDIQVECCANVGMMNPPYSQGSKKDPSQYELSFVVHLLDSLTEHGRAAVIIPQSSLTGSKSTNEQKLKERILSNHTLEGVITCNTDTFYGIGVNPAIAIFTAHEPHPKDKLCKFIDFRDDGYKIQPHIGLVESDSVDDKRQHLLDVWFNRIDAPSRFCVESKVEATDEWLHSFYYFNDEIPTIKDFEKAVGDFLTFEFSMIMQNREYLFK